MKKAVERIWEVDNVVVGDLARFIKVNGGIVFDIYNNVHINDDGREVVTIHFKGQPWPVLKEWMRLRKDSDEEEYVENLRWFARMMTC